MQGFLSFLHLLIKGQKYDYRRAAINCRIETRYGQGSGKIHHMHTSKILGVCICYISNIEYISNISQKEFLNLFDKVNNYSGSD